MRKKLPGGGSFLYRPVYGRGFHDVAPAGGGGRLYVGRGENALP